jgi:hypothetical protein
MEKPDLNALAADLRKIGADVEKLAQPLDLDSLERSGLVEKVGAWYAIPNIQHLPEHASVKIAEMKTDENGRVLVKFKKASDFDRIAKEFKKLGVI